MGLCTCPRHSTKPTDMIFGKRSTSIREFNPKYANRISISHSPTSVVAIKMNFKKTSSNSVIKVTTGSNDPYKNSKPFGELEEESKYISPEVKKEQVYQALNAPTI
jgi:hypothetical protein